jgi:ATP synthase protein I
VFLFGSASERVACNPIGSVVDSLQKRDEEDRYWAIRQAGLLTTIPVLLAASPIIGFFIGRFIDRKVNTEPVFSAVFLLLGFIAGAIQTARVVKLAGKQRSVKKEDKDRGA